MKIDGQSVWSVALSLPRDESKGRRWLKNEHVTVIAETLPAALDLVKEEFPDATVFAINHAGGRSVLIMGAHAS